jgi:two-component system chemotaxis response regulator CheY
MADLILTVDDSKVILKINSRLLSNLFPDCEILSFKNPEEALSVIADKKHVIKFALVDYNMNEMTGIEFVESLIKLPHNPIGADKVALVSANIQVAVRQKADDLGILFIAKPLDEAKLKSFLTEKGLNFGG